ncbi:MAG: VOC family protein [Actinomycetes bacterium]
MARVSIYLNFMGNAEEAFNHYRSVFGGDFTSFQRMSDVPPDSSQPPLPDNEKNLVMHVELPILGGTVLMATDMLESMGHALRTGNNVAINLEPDDLDETRRLFAALSDGATDIAPLEKMFWGAYWGTCCDRFGVRWMFNYADSPA